MTHLGRPSWPRYLENRRRNKFTVVQVHCGSGFTKLVTDRAGNAPFSGTGAALQWNPAYWQGVEQKVRAANDRGLVVFICAVRQPGTGFPAKDFPEKDPEEVARFARNLAARLMGDFVVYSPVADDEWSPLADAAGESLDRATALHLISAHPRFLLGPAATFRDKAYVDAAGLQTGEGWTYDPYKKEPRQPFSTLLAARNAREWPLDFYRRTPVKPVINHEGPYDHPIEPDGRVPLPPRKAGYWSFLSGACGFTYGCFGIWNWGQPVKWYPAYDFQTALDLPSVAQMKYLAEFFGGIRWWTLEPHPEAVLDQTDDPLHKMGFARSAAGDLAVAYLPDNAGISLNPAGLSAVLRARWFNPQDGRFAPAAAVAAGTPAATIYRRPADWEDAVLILDQQP
ncbi:MAG: DUF4038 domain-containing protein [Opitutae bacterium]|nr:DUF4038 domain-containing protein [Opitutae bacterium]